VLEKGRRIRRGATSESGAGRSAGRFRGSGWSLPVPEPLGAAGWTEARFPSYDKYYITM